MRFHALRVQLTVRECNALKYLIHKTTDLAEMETGVLAQFPWGGDYRPDVRFKIGWSDDCFYVHLRDYEEKVVATITERNGNVCLDSCMEFFFSPSADNSAGYFNIEINPNPTLLLHYGLTGDRKVRGPFDWPAEDLQISSARGTDDFGRAYWQLDYIVPFTMIRRYVPGWKPEKGTLIRANIYKCGRIDQPIHRAMWSPIDPEAVVKPDFHKPEYFGVMELA